MIPSVLNTMLEFPIYDFITDEMKFTRLLNIKLTAASLWMKRKHKMNWDIFFWSCWQYLLLHIYPKVKEEDIYIYIYTPQIYISLYIYIDIYISPNLHIYISKFYLSIVDLQCCISFRSYSKMNRIYIHIFIYSIPFRCSSPIGYLVEFPVLYSRSLLAI